MRTKAYGKKTFHLDVVAVKLDPMFKLYSEDRIHTPGDVARLAYQAIGTLDREAIAVFNIRTDGRPLSCHIAGIGTVDSCIAHPRELLKATLLTNATSIILAHNHPSGELAPSRHDIDLTARMAKLCNLMQIALLDHVIVTGEPRFGYLSMFDQGILEKKSNGAVDVSDRYLARAAERGNDYGKFYHGRDDIGQVR